MTSHTLLNEGDITSALAELDGWTVEDGALHREYLFDSFVSAFGFMAAAALCAERANHHPEWVNVYNRVTVRLSTHDAGGITAADVGLAREMEALAG